MRSLSDLFGSALLRAAHDRVRQSWLHVAVAGRGQLRVSPDRLREAGMSGQHDQSPPSPVGSCSRRRASHLTGPGQQSSSIFVADASANGLVGWTEEGWLAAGSR
jgi:hypothetical protein